MEEMKWKIMVGDKFEIEVEVELMGKRSCYRRVDWGYRRVGLRVISYPRVRDLLTYFLSIGVVVIVIAFLKREI